MDPSALDVLFRAVWWVGNHGSPLLGQGWSPLIERALIESGGGRSFFGYLSKGEFLRDDWFAHLKDIGHDTPSIVARMIREGQTD